MCRQRGWQNQPLGNMNDPLKNAKFGIWMGEFFNILPNLSSNLRKFWEKKNQVILLKIGPQLGHLVYEWVTFSWKIGICMGLLSNSTAVYSYQNQTWVPPSPIWPYPTLIFKPGLTFSFYRSIYRRGVVTIFNTYVHLYRNCNVPHLILLSTLISAFHKDLVTTLNLAQSWISIFITYIYLA